MTTTFNKSSVNWFELKHKNWKYWNHTKSTYCEKLLMFTKRNQICFSWNQVSNLTKTSVTKCSFHVPIYILICAGHPSGYLCYNTVYHLNSLFGDRVSLYSLLVFTMCVCVYIYIYVCEIYISQSVLPHIVRLLLQVLSAGVTVIRCASIPCSCLYSSVRWHLW